MYQFELENPYDGVKKVITVPEEMSIEDFTRELCCEMGLEYIIGTLSMPFKYSCVYHFF